MVSNVFAHGILISKTQTTQSTSKLIHFVICCLTQIKLIVDLDHFVAQLHNAEFANLANKHDCDSLLHTQNEYECRLASSAAHNLVFLTPLPLHAYLPTLCVRSAPRDLDGRVVVSFKFSDKWKSMHLVQVLEGVLSGHLYLSRPESQINLPLFQSLLSEHFFLCLTSSLLVFEWISIWCGPCM